jgi:hypothetical protein
MEVTSFRSLREVIGSKISLELKIHIFESDLSELAYRIWCRATGGKFARKAVNRKNSCVLVTKRGFHPLSTVIGLLRGHLIDGSELEVYKRGCSGPKPPAESRMMYWHWWDKYVFSDQINCEDCGRAYEVQDDDEKITGKF